MVSERYKLGFSAGASLVGHAIVAFLLVMAPTTRELAIQQADEIDIEIEDAPLPAPPPALVVTPPDTPPIAATVRPRHSDEPAPTGAIMQPTPEPTTTPLVAIPSDDVHDQAHHDTVVVPTEQLHALLDPTRVAATDALHDDRGPSQPGPPATLHPAGPDEHIPTAEEAVAQTQEYLGAAAAAKTYITQRTFHLTPHTDGTMHWQGTGFEAVIHPDGSVTFSDHPAVAMNWGSGSGSFDLTDLVMGGAGQDPYAAEREWFMEHAESTISRLETQARTEQHTHSLTGVRSQVRTIWEDESRSTAERRRAIFEVWDELADGSEGAPAREAVISFIRHEIPDSSAESYTMIELARMNAHRQSAERFDPYP